MEKESSEGENENSNIIVDILALNLNNGSTEEVIDTFMEFIAIYILFWLACEKKKCSIQGKLTDSSKLLFSFARSFALFVILYTTIKFSFSVERSRSAILRSLVIIIPTEILTTYFVEVKHWGCDSLMIRMLMTYSILVLGMAVYKIENIYHS